MSQQGAALPVFVDATGRRTRLVLWVARGLCAAVVVVAGAVAFTLLTNVPLPGLGGLLAPGESPRPPASGSSTSEQSNTSTHGTSTIPGSVPGTSSTASAPRPAAHTGRDASVATSHDAGAGAPTPASAGTTNTPAGSTPVASGSSKAQSTQHANANANTRAADKSSSPRATTQPNPRSTTKSDNASQTAAAHKKVDRDTADPAVG